MHDLLKAQQSFYHNVFKLKNDLSFINSSCAQERFEVYRSTIFENMRNALKITYPGIWILVGDGCADSIAYAYCQNESYLPRTGCLDDFGAFFPGFLATLPQLSSLPYLRDYAYYEWLKHLAYMAQNSNPISPADLSEISEDMIDLVQFHFCPSVFIFESDYNLSDIHEIVQDSNASSINLEPDRTYGIIGRKDNDVHTYWVTQDQWIFVKKLHDGETLMKSAEYAETINRNFDLSSAIAFVLQAQLTDKILINGGNNVN